MVSWSTIQSLLIFFGPIILPKALAFYRSLRAPSHLPPTPLPKSAAWALNLLFGTAAIFLLSTLPYFSPTNIFLATQSRLQTPTGVLFTRLQNIRPLTTADKSLRTLFESSGLEARLLYLRFGPSTLSTCPLISATDFASASQTYLLYALPSLLAPHLLNLSILGLATSAPLSGPSASRARLPTTLAALILAVLDVLALATYDHTTNATATTSAQVDFFHWKARLVRGLGLAVLDAVAGWGIYLAATGRAFVVPASAAERVEDAIRVQELVLGKLRGLGAVRNVVARDHGLRGKVERYWVNEEGMVRSVLEEREVVGALRGVLEGTDLERLSREAEGYVEGVLGKGEVQIGGQVGAS